MRGRKDDSRYQPDVREPENHPGVGNSLNLSILQFDRESKFWGMKQQGEVYIKNNKKS